MFLEANPTVDVDAAEAVVKGNSGLMRLSLGFTYNSMKFGRDSPIIQRF